MASKRYKQCYADDTSEELCRAKKQGAPVKIAELRRNHIVPVRMDEYEYRIFVAANNNIMSASRFASLMIFDGIKRLSESDNC